MTDRIGPFDTASFTQDQWYRSAKAWAPSGVVGAPAASASSGGLAMTTSGLAVTIGVGTGLSRGCLFDRDAAATVPGGTLNGNASLSRRDRIVLRRDLAAKTCAPVWLTGAPAATPTAPALTQVDTGVWDTTLFSFLVPPNNGTTITGIIDERVFMNPDADGPRGLIAHGESASTTSTSGTAEQHLTGSQNITCTLIAGRTYEVIARGCIESAGPSAGSILAVNVRAANGATPTTSSPVVANAQAYVPTSTAAGAASWVAGGEFQVGATGTGWQLHLFGDVLSVASSLTIFPDARGVHSISVYDRGPAQTSVRSI